MVVQISKSTAWTERVQERQAFLSLHHILQKVNVYCSVFFFSCVFEYDKLSFTLR